MCSYREGNVQLRYCQKKESEAKITVVICCHILEDDNRGVLGVENEDENCENTE